MRQIPYAIAATVVALAALAIGVVSATAGSASSAPTASPHMRMTEAQGGLTQSNLRALLDRQLGEHAILAMNATNLGYSGSPAFPAAVQALDRNSVALSKSIASVYGAKAGRTFLDGKYQWRAHIGFFVDYTVALAKGNKAGQAKAVANLEEYTKVHGKFLGTATGLPVKAVQNDLLRHVLELKAQLDAYSKQQYPPAAGLYQDAYAHMFMTADLLAGAISKQKDLPK